MSRIEWMLGEIKKWERDGVVSPETAARLRGRYPFEPGGISLAVMIFGCIGASLLALGVIALLAANWYAFRRPLQTFISFLPLLLCGIAAFVAIARGVVSRLVWEPLGILWSATACTGIIMISQIYQVAENFPDFLLACAAVTLPVIYITRATVPLALWPGLLAAGVCSKWTDSAVALLFWPLLAAVVPVFVHHRRSTAFWCARGLAELGLALAAVIGGTVIAVWLVNSVGDRKLFVTLFFFPALFAVLVLAGVRFRLQVLRVIGLVALVGSAMFLPYGRILKELFAGTWWIGVADWPLFAYAFVLAAAGVFLLVSTVRRYGWSLSLVFATLPAAGIAVLAPIAQLTRGASGGPLACAGLAILVAYGLVTLAEGFRTKRLMIVNAGTMLLVYAILAKFFAGDASFTVKGCVMTALGAGMLALNAVWCFRRRALGKEVD